MSPSKTTDVTYYLRPVDERTIRILKVVDDNVEKPEAVYTLINNQCHCWHAVTRKTECRHTKMKHEWERRFPHRPAIIIDYDKGTYQEVE